MQAVTVISTRRSGEFNITSTVVLAILEAAGTSLENVLTVLRHLTNREHLVAYNEEYAKFFPTNKLVLTRWRA